MDSPSSTQRLGVLHSDGSLSVMGPETTVAEASAEAALVSLTESEPAAAVRVHIREVEYLGPRVGAKTETLPG